MTAAASPETIEFFRQLQPGQRLAGCYLLSKQMHGAPDRVIWLANDEVLGKDVALHFLPQELVGRADIADRLKQEVKRNRPLIHSHILRTYDFVEEEGWSAITTDAFDGLTLAGKLEDGAREVAEIEPWVDQICSTLTEAHRIRIAHGALTPQDIVLTRDGQLKLMNFGVSAVIREALSSDQSDAAQRALGYCSPQQLEGGKPTVADDVYGLGAVVHALLTGEPPFRGTARGNPQTVAQHRTQVGHRGDAVPASWERAIALALSAAPDARPANPAQFLEVAKTPVEAEPETPAAEESPAPTEALAAAALVGAPLQPRDEVPETEPAAPAPATPEAEPANVEALIQSPAEEPSEPAPVADAEREPEIVETPLPVQSVSSDEPVPPAATLESPTEPPAEPSYVERSDSPIESAAPERPADIVEAPVAAEAIVSSGEPPPAEPAPNPVAIAEPREPKAVTPDDKSAEPEGQEEPRAGISRKPGKGTNRPGIKRRFVSTAAEEELAEQVRKEEAADEARLRGYSDEEEYISPRRGSPTRVALPLVGAAVGLLLLFGLIKWFVGSPDRDLRRGTSEGSSAQTATNTGESTAPPTTPEPRSEQPDATSTGNVPATNDRTAARVEPPGEVPRKTTPEETTTTPPTPPAKTAAEEREAALEKVRELETKLASSKKELAEKAKTVPQLLKAADELAPQQKKRDDAAAKAEQAATQAEQSAVDKRRAADEAKKAATELAEQIKSRREEHTRAQEAVATLENGIRDDQKLLAEANEAAAAAAKRAEEEAKPQPAVAETKTAPATTTTAPAATTTVPPAVETEDSEGARARNAERRKIDEEMAALRRKLAEQTEKLGATLDAARTPNPEKNPTVVTPKESTTQPVATQPPPVQPAPAPTTGTPELAMNKVNPPSVGETSPPAASETAKGARAGASGEFMNSLGMKFLAVPNTDAIFCIWPTRVRDFEPFARSTGLKSTLWKDPGFKQGPEHPVVNVTWQEAIAFCKWLTAKEQKEGLIASDQAYRLPTDLEWSIGVGLSNEPGKSPEERDMSVPDVYPWGTNWPPPQGAGNYTGEETGSDVAIKGYDDAFPWTSPVGSFPANKAGLFDMGGNVWEWCMDTWNSESKARVLRGASWYNGALKLSLLSSCRVHASPDSGTDNYGFRVVLASEGKSRR